MFTLLVVKNLSAKLRARSAVVADTGLHWRTLGDEAHLEAALRRERFAVIIVDGRGVAGDPLDQVELIRRDQPNAKVLLICERVDLSFVIRGIRTGLADVISPPFDVAALIEEVAALVGLAGRQDLAAGYWDEFTGFVFGPADAEGTAAVSAQLAEATAHSEQLTVDLARAGSFQAEAERARQDRLRFEADLADLRQAFTEVAAERAALAEEHAALAGAKAEFETTRATGGMPGGAGPAEAGTAELAAERQALREQAQRIAEAEAACREADERLQAEVMAVKKSRSQLLNEKAELAKERQQLEAERAAAEQERGKWQQTLNNVANQQAAIKRAQVQLANDRLVLATENATLERDAAALAERIRAFEARPVPRR